MRVTKLGCLLATAREGDNTLSTGENNKKKSRAPSGEDKTFGHA